MDKLKYGSFWAWGDKATLAKMTGLEKTTLASIFSRRRTVGKELALKLEAASELLGKRVSIIDWLYNESTDHPAFHKDPRPSKRLKKAMDDIKAMQQKYGN